MKNYSNFFTHYLLKHFYAILFTNLYRKETVSDEDPRYRAEWFCRT
jgi:hypothetical protein